MRILEWIWFSFFLAGWILLGVLGTGAETTWFWYGAALVAVAGVGCLLSPWRRTQTSASLPCLAAMLIFWGYMTWRGLNSEVAFLARRDLVFGSTGFVVYLLMATRFTSRRQRLLLLGTWGALVLANAIVAAYQYFEDPTWSVLSSWGLRRAAERNGGGFFPNANHLCGFLTMTGIPALAVAVLGRGVHATLRLLCGVFFLLAAGGVSLSTSRGGVVAFAGGAVLLALFSGILFFLGRAKSRSPGRVVTQLLLLLAAPALVLAPGLYVLRNHFSHTSFMDLNSRGPLWEAALAQWERYFFFGGGARSYEYIERSMRNLNSRWMSWLGEVDAVHAHNDYLQILADYGLTGFVLLVAVLAAHVFRGFRVMLQKPAEEDRAHSFALALCAGAIGALGGAAVQAMVEFNFHIGVNVVTACGLLGLLANPGWSVSAASRREKGREPVQPRREISLRRAGATVLAAGVSGVLAFQAVRLAPADYQWRKGRLLWRQAEAGGLKVEDILAASGCFQSVVERDPQNAEAWQHWGFATLTLSDQMPPAVWRSFVEKAYWQFQQSLALYPQNPLTAAHAGQTADYLRHFDEAETYFRQALRWGENIRRVNALYADHLFLTKRYREAIGYYINAIHLSEYGEARVEMRRLLELCVERLRRQGETAPPEAFLEIDREENGENPGPDPGESN